VCCDRSRLPLCRRRRWQNQESQPCKRLVDAFA
jgi:hypothetical protein